MDLRLSAVVSREGKFFVAKGVEIELASQGKNIEEALKNLREAFELWVKHAEHSELALFKNAEAPIVTQVAVAAA